MSAELTPVSALPPAYQPPDTARAETDATRLQAQVTQPGMPPPGAHGVEGVPVGQTVQFIGRTFRLTKQIPTMALLDFAAEADKGLETGDPAALRTMRDLLRRCFTLNPPCRDMCSARCRTPPGQACPDHCAACTTAGDLAEEVPGCDQYDPGDWPRFRVHALDTCADPEQLFDVVTQVIQLTTGRPT